MIPCGPTCGCYREGCHKDCAKWRLLQAKNRLEYQRKKDYLQYYARISSTVLRQLREMQPRAYRQ